MRIAAQSAEEFQFRVADTPETRNQKLEILRVQTSATAPVDIDPLLTANSDAKAASQKASKSYVDTTDAAPSVKRYSAKIDGVTDDTAHVNAALAAVHNAYIPGGTILVSQFTVPAGKGLATDGVTTNIKQSGGVPAATRIVQASSNTRLADYSVEGQLGLAGDPGGEWNSGLSLLALTTDIKFVNAGNIIGLNLRGDVSECGQSAPHLVSHVDYGHLFADNAYRQILSVTGGEDIYVRSVTGTRVGLFHLDLEPYGGNGPVIAFRCPFVKGRYASFGGQNAADYVDAVWVGYMRMDAALTGPSAPDYPFTITNGLQLRNIKYGRVEKADISGFDGPGVYQVNDIGDIAKQTISFGELRLANCALTDVVHFGYINGAEDVTRLLVDSLIVDVGLAAKAGVSSCYRANVRSTEATGIVGGGGIFRNCWYMFSQCFNYAGAGTPYVDCDYMVAAQGTVSSNATPATALCSFSDYPLFIQYTSWATALFNTCVGGRLIQSWINGVFYYDYAHNIATGNSIYQIDANGNFLTIGNLLTSGGKVGYTTGAGSSQAQATSRGTAVTLNKVTGKITLFSTTTIAGQLDTFTWNNSQLGANDTITWTQLAGAGFYIVNAINNGNGTATVNIYTPIAVAVAEAPAFQFNIIQGKIT